MIKNINLNAGGIIGGFLGAALGIGFVVVFGPTNRQEAMAKVAVAAIILGAIGGNYLWGWIAGLSRSQRL